MSRESGGAAELLGAPGPEAYERLEPRVWILGGLMLLIGVVTSVLMLRDFRSDSYLYLAFYAIPSNTALSVFPHEPVLLYFGKFGVLWIVALAATAGNLVAGYMDHAVFVPVLNHRALRGYRDRALYRRAMAYFRRAPFATVAVASFAPVPFWPVKFLSFSGGYPLGRYLAAIALGRFPRYYLLAWLGAAIAIPTWILIALFLGVVGVYAANAAPRVWARRRKRRRERAAAAAARSEIEGAESAGPGSGERAEASG